MQGKVAFEGNCVYGQSFFASHEQRVDQDTRRKAQRVREEARKKREKRKRRAKVDLATKDA